MLLGGEEAANSSAASCRVWGNVFGVVQVSDILVRTKDGRIFGSEEFLDFLCQFLSPLLKAAL